MQEERRDLETLPLNANNYTHVCLHSYMFEQIMCFFPLLTGKLLTAGQMNSFDLVKIFKVKLCSC